MIEDLSGGWRQTHLGRLLGLAMRRFDERVLVLMASNVNVPLGLSHLAARGQVGAAHIHITRHLAVEGSRLTDLARAAGMSKQAMGNLVDQCEAWGLVTRLADARDARSAGCPCATGLLHPGRSGLARSVSRGRESGRAGVSLRRR